MRISVFKIIFVVVATITFFNFKIAFADTWDVSTATYDNKFVSVNSGLYDVFFKSDGTKMYTAGNFSDKKIYQYSLSTAWDVSTATLEKSKDVTSQGAPMSIDFNTDGSKMYLIGFYSDNVFEYDLGTNWDIATATYNSVVKYFSGDFGDSLPYGGTFASNGEKFYVLDSYDEKVYQYSLPTPWDLSTLSFDNKSLSIGAYGYYHRDLFIDSTGTKMYLSSDLSSPNGSELISQFTLSTAWDISTASYDSKSLNVNAQDTNPSGVFFKSTGDKMYVAGGANNKIFQYILAAPDITAPTISSIDSNSTSNSVTITWTTDEESSSQIEYGLISSYGSQTSETDTSTRVTSHSVTISSLASCARYYYRAKSTDASSNQAVSSQNTFVTSGCPIGNVTSGQESYVDKDTGGTLNLTNNTSQVTLTVPVGFNTTSANFQINVLENSGVTPPSNTQLIDQNFYELLAVDTGDNNVTSFDNDITFVIEYTNDAISNYIESTLDLYKYNSGTWEAKSCTVNDSANTLTCTLSGFSPYGMFGQQNNSTQSTSNTFHEDKRCHWEVPKNPTWILAEPMIKDGVEGMNITWTQYDANKINILIDDGTNTYPWKIEKTLNDGHEFLPNVQPWQNIKIKPINNCADGEYIDFGFSYNKYKNGWYNL